MPSPFPGMDPYLESPEIWPDVHHGLISEIKAALQASLRPHYIVRVARRVYISDDDDPGREALVPGVHVGGPPRLLDEEIKEAYLKVTHLESDTLVTVIEVLSPTNKIHGSRGRASFMEGRHEILNSEVNWVEVDLLRGGVPSVTHPPLVPSDYRVLVSRAGQRTQAQFWPISVRQALPVIGVPLRGKDPDLPLELGAVFKTVYDRGAYDLSLNYRKGPQPLLDAADAVWAKELLRSYRGK